MVKSGALVFVFAFLLCACTQQSEKTNQTQNNAIFAHLPSDKDSLLNLLPLTGADTNRVNVLFQLGSVLPRFSDTARIVALQSLKLSSDLDYAHGIVNAANNLGNYYYFRAKNDSAVYYYRLAESLLDKMWDPVLTGRTYGNLGNHYKALAQFDSSIYYSKLAYAVFERIGDQQRSATTLNNMGFAYVQTGEYDSAIDCHLRCLKTRQAMNDSAGISVSYTNISTIYFEQKDYAKVKYYVDLALAIDFKRGDTNAIAGNYNNLGEYYRSLKNYDSATYYLKKGLALNKLTGNNTWLVVSLNNLGLCSQALGNYPEAISYFNQSLSLYEESGDQMGAGNAYGNLGRTYLRMKNYELAKSSLETALVLSVKSGAKMRIQESYKALADFYYESGKYQDAYDYRKKYEAVKDTLFEEGKRNYIEELMVKYKAEKQEKELLQKNTEIKQKDAESLQRATERNTFIGGFAVVLLFSIFLYNRFSVTRKQRNIINLQKEVVENQKMVVEEKNKSITDSINYSRRIQHAMLTSEVYMNKHLPQHFVQYKPKDIVSGDFYWLHSPSKNKVLLATADCTGHGVPGALMSMIGISLLNDVVIEKKNYSPAIILGVLREEIINALNPEGAEDTTNDGMDISLCYIDFENLSMEVSAANNAVYIVRDGKLLEFEPDNFPVGNHMGDNRPFKTHHIPLLKNDLIYTFTDGFADQFGGPKGKKFKYSQFKNMLISLDGTPISEQKNRIENVLNEWKGTYEQVDDICIIGICI